MGIAELTLLLEALTRQVQQCQADLAALRAIEGEHTEKAQERLDELRAALAAQFDRITATLTQYVTKEQWKTVEDEIEDLRQEIRDVKNAVIENQNQKFKETINRQNMVLGAIVVAVIGYFIPQLLQIIFHH